MTQIPYGAASQLRFDLPPDAVLAAFATPCGEPIADLYGAAMAALAAPLEFPPLSQAAFPGDRVVVAVGADVPQAEVFLRAIVEVLTASGVTPESISVLHPQREDGATTSDPRAALPVEHRLRVGLIEHTPEDGDRIALLGTSRGGRRFDLNRAVVDADLVVAVGCASGAATPQYFGIHGELYPGLASSTIQHRYRGPRALVDGPHRDPRVLREVREASRRLGIPFAVQVIPGEGDSVLGIFAGEIDTVSRRAASAYRDAWGFTATDEARLVVATINGGPQHQTWRNFGRAIAACRSNLAADGALVLCTELSEAPGTGIRALAETEEVPQAIRWIRRHRPADVMPAMQLATLLEEHRVYLLSRLDDELVEDLGIIPVETEAEVARLAQRSGRCVLLANAHRLDVSSDVAATT